MERREGSRGGEKAACRDQWCPKSPLSWASGSRDALGREVWEAPSCVSRQVIEAVGRGKTWEPGSLPHPDHALRERRAGLVQPSGPGHGTRADPEARQQRKSTGLGWTNVGGRES